MISSFIENVQRMLVAALIVAIIMLIIIAPAYIHQQQQKEDIKRFTKQIEAITKNPTLVTVTANHVYWHSEGRECESVLRGGVNIGRVKCTQLFEFNESEETK